MEAPMYGTGAMVYHKHDHDHDHDYEKTVATAGCGCGCGCKGGDGMLEGLLMGMCQKSGIDPGLIALMKDKDHDGMFGGSGMLVLLFLIILLGGRGGFGFGGHDGHRDGGYGNGYGWANGCGSGLDKIVFDCVEKQGLSQQLAFEKLAAEIGVKTDQIKNALCCLEKGQAVIEGKINFMDCDIKNAIERCCCNMQLAVERGNNALSRQLAECCCKTDAKIERLERRMDEQFCKTDALIVKCDTDSRIRGLEAELAREKSINLRSFERRQTDVILDALQKIAPAGTIIEDVGHDV